MFCVSQLNILSSEKENGPWTKAVESTLEDSRNQKDPLPLQTFYFKAQEAQFVRVRAKSFYGNGAGLQFLQLTERGFLFTVLMLIYDVDI